MSRESYLRHTSCWQCSETGLGTDCLVAGAPFIAPQDLLHSGETCLAARRRPPSSRENSGIRPILAGNRRQLLAGRSDIEQPRKKGHCLMFIGFFEGSSLMPNSALTSLPCHLPTHSCRCHTQHTYSTLQERRWVGACLAVVTKRYRLLWPKGKTNFFVADIWSSEVT